MSPTGDGSSDSSRSDFPHGTRERYFDEVERSAWGGILAVQAGVIRGGRTLAEDIIN
jgi:hypothetical protein